MACARFIEDYVVGRYQMYAGLPPIYSCHGSHSFKICSNALEPLSRSERYFQLTSTSLDSILKRSPFKTPKSWMTVDEYLFPSLDGGQGTIFWSCSARYISRKVFRKSILFTEDSVKRLVIPWKLIKEVGFNQPTTPHIHQNFRLPWYLSTRA